MPQSKEHRFTKTNFIIYKFKRKYTPDKMKNDIDKNIKVFDEMIQRVFMYRSSWRTLLKNSWEDIIYDEQLDISA